jgi:hypothetical protein
MRKITNQLGLDDFTFSPMIMIRMLEEDGTITELAKIDPFNKQTKLPSKYTLEDWRKIEQCNKLLVDRGLSEMTEEENDWMIDPTGLRWKPLIDTKPEDLERLSGFVVEKTIKYFDDLKETSK